MNKTIIININSIVFHIEEDAYETLRAYMIDIKRHFGKSEDSKEILEDIENRVAEMFSERIHTGRKEVINLEDVNLVISRMGRVSDFEEVTADDDETPTDNPTDKDTLDEEPEPRQEFPEPEYFSKKLMRDTDDKVFGGVCSGLGHYFGIESKWTRIIFVLFFLFGGSGVLLYLILWMVMPEAVSRADKMAMRGEAPNLQNFKKSFEKEMEDIHANFADTGDHIKRNSRSIGDLIGGVLRFFVKLLGYFALFTVASVIVGLLIVFIMNTLNFMGYENEIMFPPLRNLDYGDGFFALLAGILAIGIPFFALFYLLIRALFNAQPMNNYASLTLFTTWILCIFAIIYYSVTTAQDFKETSTIKVEKKIDAKPNYVIAQRDMRVINASDEEFASKKINLSDDKHNLRDILRDDINIRIESIDSLEKPFIQYNYLAKGRNFKQASDRASQIQYNVVQEDKSLIFDSHFALQDKHLHRDQRVDISLFLPVGTKITIMNDMDYKVRNSAWIHDCYPDINHKSTEWIMTKNGLKCNTVVEEEKKEEESVTNDEE